MIYETHPCIIIGNVQKVRLAVTTAERTELDQVGLSAEEGHVDVYLAVPNYRGPSPRDGRHTRNPNLIFPSFAQVLPYVLSSFLILSSLNASASLFASLIRSWMIPANQPLRNEELVLSGCGPYGMTSSL